MVTTIQQAMHPLFLTFRVLGLGIHILQKIYLNILYNVTLWITYGCLYYYVVIGLKVDKYYQTTSSLVNIVMNLFVSIISIFTSSYQHKRMRKFMKRFDIIDDTLKELGTPKVYQKLHIRIKGILIGWLVCSQIINITEMIWWFYAMENYWCMIIPYITNHYQHINMLVDLLFIILLWYIGTRFDKLNEYIRCLLLREKHNVRCTWRKTGRSTRYIMYINNYKGVLWTTMQLHLELCQAARELNAIFGKQITMEMVTYFACLTRLLYHISLDIIKGETFMTTPLFWIDFHFWIFLYVARLFWINYVCESVSAKSNKMNAIIHRLTDSPRYADLRPEIYQFTLQIIQHPLKFSGIGLFHFGNGFLRKFFMTVVTYVIIITQMSNIYKTSIKKI